MAGEAEVISLDKWVGTRNIDNASKQFLQDIRSNPFVAIVTYGDKAIVFTKDMDREEIRRMRDVLNAHLVEGTTDANS